MLFLALSIQAPIMGVISAIAIGHIIDIRWEWIKAYFLKEYEYQKRSEDFIFLLGFYCYILNVNAKKAAKVLTKEIVTQEPAQVESLLVYYIENYIPKNFKRNKNSKNAKSFNDKVVKAKASIMVNIGDNVNFFNLIESIYNNEFENASAADIELLKKIANDFSIDYNRSYQYQAKQSAKPENTSSKKSEKANFKEEKTKYEYKAEEPKQSTSYISVEVKDAFKTLGFNAENPPTLIKLKQEYKKQVRKCHPDMVGGGDLSAKKAEELNQKLTKLNKSMDIAKKFLANS